jgi:triosephosphate isomerase
VARTPLIAGNWKMNLNHLEAIALVQKLAFTLRPADHDAVDVVVLPPFTDLRSVQTLIDGEKLRIAYGAQDLSLHDSGAYTGEISGEQLAKLGCSFVLVGHSERREHHAETDEVVGAKLAAARRHGLTPIVCVGESLDVRQQGFHLEFVLGQLDAALDALDADAVAALVLAYEPVWAIGTGETATPDDAQEVCEAMRGRVRERWGDAADAVRILYGGSMKPANAPALMAKDDIDGGLIGGASLAAEDFARIVRYRDEIVL